MYKKLKVLWLTNIPTPYTIPVWAALGQWVDLKILCLSQSEPGRLWRLECPPNVTFLDAPVLHSQNHATYGLSRRLQRQLAYTDYDAIVLDGWQAPAYIQAYLHAKLTNRRIVLSYWSTGHSHKHSRGIIPAIRSTILKGANAIVTPGETTSACLRDIGVSPERVFTGFAPVDVQFFSVNAKLLRPRVPFPRGHRYLYVGQLIERKNINSALKAFKIVRQPGDTFRLVGAGPLQKQLKEQAASLGIVDAVHFKGHLEGAALVEQYASANTLVLPSTEEVWGLVLNEALAAGMHVVPSLHCGAVRSLITMKGVYPANAAPDDLATAMRQSARDWRGPIAEPEILSKTPSAYASTILDALALPNKDPLLSTSTDYKPSSTRKSRQA